MPNPALLTAIGCAAFFVFPLFTCGADPAGPGMTLTLLSSETVRCFERIEFKLEGIGNYANPHDPSAIRVELALSHPTGAPLVVPAFFHQAFEFQSLPQGNRRREWIYPVNQPEWIARFAAEVPGTYTAVAVATDGRGIRRSNAVRFTCVNSVPSTEKGYVRVSSRDPRFFEFTDGSPFFAIGQNVAFVGPDQYLNTERAGEVFRKMASQGANVARVWVCAEDWALGLEARKSVWGRSWSWKPPFVPVPDRDGYHASELCVRLGAPDAANVTLAPTHPIALRAGATYVLSGSVRSEADATLQIDLEGLATNAPVRSEKRGAWNRFARTVAAGSNQWWLGRLALRTEGAGNVFLRDLSLRESGTGPELLWEAEPRLSARGAYNEVDSYLLDRLIDAAEQAGVFVQLCLLTRDHYMHDLRDPASAAYQGAIDDARKLLRYAVARWGYSPHVLAWEYFNEMDPGAPTERFHRELGEHLERMDPYRHLRTTSGWGSAPKHWNHPHLDIADLHHYLRPNASPPWTNEVAAILERTALLRAQAPHKPAVLGEFGLADETWGLSPHMKQDTGSVLFHNALWASAFSGLSGTAMFWWWETLDQLDAYPHYRPLADFVASIPFTTARLEPVSPASENQRCRLLAWRGPDQAFCWIFNLQATWWEVVMEKRIPQELTGESVRLNGMRDGNYRVQWWDTRSSKVLQETKATSADRDLKLVIPPFARDIACKIHTAR